MVRPQGVALLAVQQEPEEQLRRGRSHRARARRSVSRPGLRSGRGSRACGRHRCEDSRLDPSPSMVERAAERVPQAEVRLGSAESIPFEDDVFTAAISVSTYHHWADAETGLKEVRRVLAPGGRLLIVERKLKRSAGHGLDDVGGESLASCSRPTATSRSRSRPSRLVEPSIWPCPQSNPELQGQCSAASASALVLWTVPSGCSGGE